MKVDPLEGIPRLYLGGDDDSETYSLGRAGDDIVTFVELEADGEGGWNEASRCSHPVKHLELALRGVEVTPPPRTLQEVLADMWYMEEWKKLRAERDRRLSADAPHPAQRKEAEDEQST